MTLLDKIAYWTQHDVENKDIVILDESLLDSNSVEAKKVCNAISAITMDNQPLYPRDIQDVARKPNVTIYFKNDELVLDIVPKERDSNNRKNSISIHVVKKGWHRKSESLLSIWILNLSKKICEVTKNLIERSFDEETIYELCVGITLVYARIHRKRWFSVGALAILASFLVPFLFVKMIGMRSVIVTSMLFSLNNLIMIILLIGPRNWQLHQID